MQNSNPEKKKNNVLKKWLRIIHRDLGFLMVGISLVYAISGILLNHMNDKDPAFAITKGNHSLEKNLSKDELTKVWEANADFPKLNKIYEGDRYHQILVAGGDGLYNLSTGELSYEVATKRPFIYWINKLHYNKVGGWSIMADFFAISLIFFAISGLFIVSKKYGVMGRGKWYLIVGILIPILYIVFS